ncbi:hypothetical protein, partial [Alteribacter natronophilus]|uniref:hypothetical protein n=1 Tax=Alteribacter natronophilus TaxID=2583810 RepID=UPI001AEDFC6E
MTFNSGFFTSFLLNVEWPLKTKQKPSETWDILNIPSINFHFDVRDIELSTESLILAQDERWRRA